MYLGRFIRTVFNLLARKVCFAFAVSFFSVMGAAAAIPGMIYIWGTVDYVPPNNLRADIILCLILIAVAALAHYLCMGLPRLWGCRWELKGPRVLNDHLHGLSVPIDIATPDLNEVSRRLDQLPAYNARLAIILSGPVFLIAIVREMILSPDWRNWLAVAEGSFIAWSIYLMFTFLITEIITTDVRKDARWLLAMRDAWQGPGYTITLLSKFAFILVLIIVSIIITRGVSSSTAIHSELAAVLIFTGMILAVGVCMSGLIFISIRDALREIRETAIDLSEGQSAQFISGSINREFVDTARGIYDAARKIVHYRDELQTMNAELEQKVQERTAEIKLLSITDALTGCYNRGHMNEHLPKEILKSRRYGHPLSVVMCDLDHFKQVNDSHGHQAGDHVLQEFVHCIKGLYRNDLDWVARYGGEEFLIVLPDTDLNGASRLAERVRRGIEERVIQIGPATIHITASFGVTCFSGDTTDEQISFETLINQADAYLYQAKEQGRNRIVAGELGMP